MVDAKDLKSFGRITHAGSTPASGTNNARFILKGMFFCSLSAFKALIWFANRCSNDFKWTFNKQIEILLGRDEN